jgi:outer membrane lipoprotein carrier protein
MTRIGASMAVALLSGGAAIVLAQQPSATDLAARIQRHYSTVRDLSADFTLTQTSALAAHGATDKGTVLIKKPNRMRWTFETGSHNVMVADGTRLYSYFPQDKYVQQSALPQGDEAPTALLFLAGRGDLTRDFTVALAPDQPAGEWRVVFTPKNRRADFKTLTLEVDRGTLQLRGFTVADDQGAVQHFRLTHVRENTGVPDSAFVFTIPKGVEVR